MSAQSGQPSSALGAPALAATSKTRTSPLSRVAGRLLANEWATAAVIFAVTRAVGLFGAYQGINYITTLEPERNKGWVAELGMMWDAAWYVVLAKDGYYYHPDFEGGTNVAFPPLYPLLIRGGSEVLRSLTFGWNWGNETYGALVAAGLIISNVSFIVALALLIRLLTPRLGRPGAAMVALALASLPVAFFFSAVYTEGLFLLLIVGAFVVARSGSRHRWAWVGCLGLAASLLKFAGILFLPVMAVEYLAQKGWRIGKIRADVLWLGLVPVGLLLFMGYLWLQFGSPFVFLDSEYKGWNHQTSFFWATYYESAEALWLSLSGAKAGHYDWILVHGDGSPLWAIIDLSAPVVLLIGAIVARKKLFASEWAWLLFGVLFPLSSGTTNSLARYMLPLWPGLVWAGMVRGWGRWVVGLLIVLSLGLMGYCAYIYGSAKWIG